MLAMAAMKVAEACFLQAALIAAAAGIAVRNHGDVPQFARHAQISLQHSAAGDDAAADAGAQRQQDQIVHVASRAHPLLAQRGGVGIVFQDDMRAQAAFDLGTDGEVFQRREIVRVADDAFLQQDETGDADADARQPSAPQESRNSAMAFTMWPSMASRPAAGLVAVARRSRTWPARSMAAARKLVPPRSRPMAYSGMKRMIADRRAAPCAAPLPAAITVVNAARL
jgi:hypothetical protein